MTLNDLGRAVRSDLYRFREIPDTWTPKWEDLEPRCRDEFQVMALAAVERFAEAYCADRCPRCREGQAAINDDGLWWHEDLHWECYASSMKDFIASLRAEAGQKSNAAQLQKGSE